MLAASHVQPPAVTSAGKLSESAEPSPLKKMKTSFSHKGSLVPRLSPRANEKSKERGEPGRIYHVRNVIGRENLITCGRTNELAHAVRTEYSCDSFMADRMGLDGTMLHYLAVRKATVSVHKPVHSKITLTYSLTWQADRCTSQRMAFKAY